MSAATALRPLGATPAFLAVDGFQKTLVEARALKTAFEIGLIDRLAGGRGGSTEALGRALGIDPAGLALLLGLLVAAGVLERIGGDIRLTRRFAAALAFRDLMEAKLDLAGLVLTDFADLFTMLVTDPGAFQARARLFDLFDYRRCLRFTIEDYARARAWMRITTVLTRYEAGPAMDACDLSAQRRALDVGGNSGEFLVQLCRRHPSLTGTVFDLPLVCEIGLEHVLAQPEHPRIGFRAGDLRAEDLPAGHDLVTFKSMLHDWPVADTAAFIAKAARAVAPGGTVLVYERACVPLDRGTPPLTMLPHLVFYRSYRDAADYVAMFADAGLRDVVVRDVELDSPFLLVTARRPA